MTMPVSQLRLPGLLLGSDEEALRALRTYFRAAPSGSGYTGRWFDTWDPDGRRVADLDCFTDADFTAVTHLSVGVPSRAAVRLVREQAHSINDLLERISADLDLADVPPEEITRDWPAWQLWILLRSGRDGLGPTKTRQAPGAQAASTDPGSRLGDGGGPRSQQQLLEPLERCAASGRPGSAPTAGRSTSAGGVAGRGQRAASLRRSRLDELEDVQLTTAVGRSLSRRKS